ncbi:MAG: M20/M25/M40 family metallo-hydrolase, partial [Bryobacteraceae bacterium]|nr:M20/M25/M40 family metallo-hydrolase [Bryobacteraceae bacterium]
MVRVLATAILFAVSLGAQTGSPLADRAVEYLQALIRIDSSNPPGNESRVAEYLQTLANEHGIENELLGGDPERLNFIARLRGTGRERPLLLMAHMDVVPAETEQWNAPPFSGEVRDGFIYGRGALDAKNLLAAHFAVLVELKRRSVKLKRDIILLAEADEEAGASGIRWLIENAYPKLDAEFAINEGGSAVDMSSGVRLF